jgi:hypothetical protein
MKGEPYKRKPGDFEIRVLKSGRVVMIAPDETMLEVAQAVDPGNANLSPKTEKEKDDRAEKSRCTDEK